MSGATLVIKIDGKSAERDLERLERSLGKLDTAADKTTRSMDKMSKTARQAGATIGKAFAVGVAAFTAVSAAAIKAVDNLDKVGKTADKIGLTTDSLQELRFAAEQSGVGITALDMGMQRFARRTAEAAQGSGVLKDEFKSLGIELKDASGNLRSMDDVLDDYADAIMNAGSEQEQLRLAFKAFDSEGAALVNLFRKGAIGVQEFRDRAQELGIVIEEDIVRQAEAASDALNEMNRMLGAQMTVALSKLIPLMESFSNAVVETFNDESPQDFTNAVIKGGEIVIKVAAAIADGFRALTLIFDGLVIGWRTFVLAAETGALAIMHALDSLPFVDLTLEIDAMAGSVSATKEEIAEMMGALDARLLEQTFGQKGAALIKKFHEEMAETADETKKVANVIRGDLTPAVVGATDEVDTMYATLEKLGIGLDDVSVQTIDLNKALDTGAISWAQYSDSMLDAELAADGFGESTKELAETTKTEVDEMEGVWSNFIENTQRAFGDLIFDNMKSVLDDGKLTFKDFTDTILDMFLRMLADMAAAWLASKLFGGAGGGLLGGLLGGASGGGGGGGLGGIISGGLGKLFGGGGGITSGGGGGAIGSGSIGGVGETLGSIGTKLKSIGSSAKTAITGWQGVTGATAAFSAAAVAAIIVMKGINKEKRIDAENAAYTDQFNELRLNTNEFAGELMHVNDNLTIVGQSAEALYIRQTQANEANQTHFYEYTDALKEAGIGIRQIYTETGAQIQMVTGDLARAHEIIAAGFDNAKAKATQFTTHTNSKLTTLTTKFTGSTNEWKALLQDAMDSGKVSADATFKFMQDESGQTFLKMTGDANEWADYLAKAGKLGVGSVETEFQSLDAAGQQVFGNLSAEAMAFQSTLNSLRAPTLYVNTVYDDVSSGINTPGSMDGFANGGSFTVGGNGMTDTTPVSFMATKGETVSINTQEESQENSSELAALLERSNELLAAQLEAQEETARQAAKGTRAVGVFA